MWSERADSGWEGCSVQCDITKGRLTELYFVVHTLKSRASKRHKGCAYLVERFYFLENIDTGIFLIVQDLLRCSVTELDYNKEKKQTRFFKKIKIKF